MAAGRVEGGKAGRVVAAQPTTRAAWVAFARALVAEGVALEVTAVERPEVDLAACRALADSVGASAFRARSYHP